MPFVALRASPIIVIFHTRLTAAQHSCIFLVEGYLPPGVAGKEKVA
ncbi:MAG: hypothetical protein U9P14_06775 [Gemmatimonadota bacterium]|nr:hypothetical protein [Gemmatimonadota bacterium]